MGFDDDKNEVELSLEDLHRMIEESNEIEIDLDDIFHRAAGIRSPRSHPPPPLLISRLLTLKSYIRI